jgi:histidinol-phosphate aminotransferase
VERLRPYEAGKPIEELARELGVTDAVKLASNENPFGPSPKALAAAAEALGSVHRYPDAAAYRLRERLAAEHGVKLEQVLHGNGSNDLLDLLVRTFCSREDHVVFAQLSFVVYELACLSYGIPYTAVPLQNWTHDLPAMARAIEPNTKLVFIANPNNPTGTHVGRDALVKFLREVPEEVIVVIDEAYLHYVDAEDYADAMTLRQERERLVITRTFSKAYGLAALRVGYAVAPRELIDYMLRVRQPFSVGSVAQAAALAALDDTEHVAKGVAVNSRERVRVARALTEFGFEPAPSQANFVFVDLRQPGRPVYDQLLRRGVIVRPIGETSYLRITLGTEAENDRFLAAFREVVVGGGEAR